MLSTLIDITERQRAEEAWRLLNEELKQWVEERTGEWRETVGQLEEEMSERQQAEQELDKLNKELEQRVGMPQDDLADDLHRDPESRSRGRGMAPQVMRLN